MRARARVFIYYKQWCTNRVYRNGFYGMQQSQRENNDGYYSTFKQG